MSDAVELKYNLAELPSSQHRAGLAGLVLMVRWLERDKSRKGICELVRLDEFGATVRIDQAGLQELFDETYAASFEEQARDKEIKNQRTKQIVPYKRAETRLFTDPKTGKSKEKRFYIYEFPIPRGAFLLDYDPSSDGKDGLWIKLWRDLVWNVLRGIPATREPYKDRAKGQSTKEAGKAWQVLNRPGNYTVNLASTYFIGAQDANAENVPFMDRARFHLLLHFCAFVAQIYVPTISVYDKNTKQFKIELSKTYVLAIPDVLNLVDFCDELPLLLKNNRSVDKFAYRPHDNVIDLPAESALDLMNKLNQRLAAAAGGQSVADLVLGVDVFHLEKQGNNIRLWSTARIDPTRSMIDEYARVKGMFRYALFRRQRLLNMLNEREWFSGFDSLLCTTDSEQTIGSRFFRADVKTAFKDSMQSNQSTKGEQDEVNTDAPKQIANQTSVEDLIYQLVGTYIRAKLKSKNELEWKDAFKGTQAERDYNDKKAKIARDAFLSVRSRTGDDFIEYFVATLCSFPQFLNEEGYVTLAQALHTDTDKARTLTLLALSARG
jgi:CRISPR-associated protein Cmx8